MHIYGLNLKAWKIQQVDSRLPVRVLHTRRKTYTFVVLCFGRRLLFPHERVKCKNTYLQVFQKGCQQQAWNMHPLKLYNLDLKNGFFSLAAKFIMEVCWTFSRCQNTQHSKRKVKVGKKAPSWSHWEM